MPTHYQGSPDEIRSLNTFIRFTRAYESFMARLMKRGSLGDLTLSQFGVLEVLYHLGPMCQGEVSTKLLKSSGNITLVLDNLEKRDLIQRRRDQQDRRMVMISLTPAGEKKIKEVLPLHIAAIVDELSELSPDEQQVFGDLCKKLGLGSPS
jgi:MarR family 2-MHQ and catechol resistance regulon transcriptional repressor